MRRVQSQVIWLLACMLVRGDPSLPKDAHVFDQGEEMTPEMLLQKCTTPPAQTNARLANRRNRWMSFRVRWGRPWEKVPAARQNHRADWRSCHPRRPHHQRLSTPITHHTAALRAAPRRASPRHACCGLAPGGSSSRRMCLCGTGSRRTCRSAPPRMTGYLPVVHPSDARVHRCTDAM